MNSHFSCFSKFDNIPHRYLHEKSKGSNETKVSISSKTLFYAPLFRRGFAWAPNKNKSAKAENTTFICIMTFSKEWE